MPDGFERPRHGQAPVLPAADLVFLARRRWLARRWAVVAAALLAVLAGLALWLAIRVPNLVNPYHVLRQVESGTLSRSLLETMAVLLPLAIAALLAVLCAVVALGFAVSANERRYLRIVDALLERARRGGEEGS